MGKAHGCVTENLYLLAAMMSNKIIEVYEVIELYDVKL